MEGYKVDYIDNHGKKRVTWLGTPIASFGLVVSDINDLLRTVMLNAHPGCRVVRIVPCCLEDFEA